MWVLIPIEIAKVLFVWGYLEYMYGGDVACQWDPQSGNYVSCMPPNPQY